MKKKIGIVFLCIFSLSCSSDLDFNQVNDLKLEPVVVTNLATFDVQAHQFVDGGVEQTVSGDLMDFDVFKESFFDENLTRADFFFEYNNTINRGFRINIFFVDANNAAIYTIPFNIPAYSGTQNLVTKTEIFQNVKLDLLKKTSKVAFVVTLLPGPALSENSLGSLKLRSSATLYFVVE
ncbi:hypothetical protein SAMN05443549_10525 [Flavobacterium fluvii]|uniref:Lipoprotein n=1 Tax=Flavobacterium fluvii TaxID=468056 RepID=A0A1M5L0C5_9FLAO|nr:hypothetical protein [Flavobacterium fluvii]SHG58446.1 hypothetical protein SAMN05443549_10525 [Flavobacterium fluvii]